MGLSAQSFEPVCAFRPSVITAQLLRENEVFVQAIHEAQRDGRVREMAMYLERLTSSVARLGKLLDLQTLGAAQLPERREVRPAMLPTAWYFQLSWRQAGLGSLRQRQLFGTACLASLLCCAAAAPSP